MTERRQTQDRRADESRRRASRRRAADARTLVVELGESEMHVALLTHDAQNDADNVSASAAPWRTSNAPPLHTPEGCTALTAALREAANRHAAVGANLHVLLGGTYCTTRVFRGANEVVRSELAQIEQRSRLYLALGPGQKTVVTAVRQIDARRQYAQALVCNQATLDAVSRAAEAAGLNLVCVEAALVGMNRALARVKGLPSDPYLLVHMSGQSIEIGVCRQGELLLDYRPSGVRRPEEIAEVLCEHINRLRRFVERQSSAETTPLRRLYLQAPDDIAQEAQNAFRRITNIEVQRIGPHDVDGNWRIARDEAPHATLATLGGVLRHGAMAKDEAPDMMRHILDSTREPLRPILLRSAAPLAAVLLAAVAMALGASHFQGRASMLQASLNRLAPVEGRSRELQLQSISRQAKLKEMKRLAAQLPGAAGDKTVRLIGQCLPDDVWLTRLEVVDLASLKVQGASFLEAGVYDFVRWLELAPQFAQTALKGTTPASSSAGPVTNFEVDVQLAADDGSKLTQIGGGAP